MKELLVNAGLTEEQITSILDAMKESKVFTTKEENIDKRYAKLKEQKEELKNQLEAANMTIDSLKQSNLANDNLQKEVETYKAKVQEIEIAAAEKVKTLTLDNAIKSKLNEFDNKYHGLLEKAFDRHTLQVDEQGNVIGLDEQYNSIKDTYSDLLIAKVAGRTPVNPQGNNKWLISKEQFNQMSYKERMDLYNTNPDTYKQLSE